MTTEAVIEAFCVNDPISLIRCGDGEKIVLDGFESYMTYNSILKRQLGYSPPIEDAEAIRNNLMQAINRCDIIGVPRHKNLKHMGSHWRNVENSIEKYCPNVTSKRCSLDIHYDLLEGDGFDKMLLKKPIAYIGCRDLTAGLMRRFQTQRVDWYKIAPEAKFTSYDPQKEPRHYPDQFIRLERWMDSVKPQGRILLVGAGIIGKIYCNWWRDRGGKAIDIGSVMDEWAGRVTRGPDRELDKYVKSKYTIIDQDILKEGSQ